MKTKSILKSLLSFVTLFAVSSALASRAEDRQPLSPKEDSALLTRTTGTENWRNAGPVFYTFEQICSGESDFTSAERSLMTTIKLQLVQEAYSKYDLDISSCSEVADYFRTKTRLIDLSAKKMSSFKLLVHLGKELVDFQKAGGKTNFKGLFLSGYSIDPAQTEMLDIYNDLEGFKRINLPYNDPEHSERAKCPLEDKSKCI